MFDKWFNQGIEKVLSKRGYSDIRGDIRGTQYHFSNTQGSTLEEARSNLFEALEMTIEANLNLR